MKTIVKGLAIEYADEGAGPVILMLHGWKDDLRTFDALVPFLRDFRIVRLDLPGFGGSDMPRGTWKLDDYVDLVGVFIEKLRLNADVIASHSFGGRISIKGLAGGIFKPRKVVLIASAGVTRRKTSRNVLLRLLAKTGKTATSLWPLSIWRGRLRQGLYEWIGGDYFGAGALKQTFLNIIEEDLQPFAARIAAPALLVWGSEDSVTPLEDGERLRLLIAGSRLEVIQDAGHFVHRERAPDVARLIQSFIKDGHL